MPRTVLIGGAQAPLVVSLAARYLADTDESVLVTALREAGPGIDDYRARILHEAGCEAGCEAGGPTAAHRAGRLSLVTMADVLAGPGRPGHRCPPRVDTAWYAAAGYAGADPRLCLRIDRAAARPLIAAARTLGARQFCYVGPGGLDDRTAAALAPGVVAGYQSHEREIAADCQAAGLRHLIIRVSPVLGSPAGAGEPVAGPGELVTGLPHLVDSVGWLKEYVAARDPDYFAVHPVRVVVAPGGLLDVVTAAAAARSLLRLGESGEPPGRSLDLPAETVGAAEALATVAAAHGIRLTEATDAASLNAVDRLLADRLGGFAALLRVPGPAAGPSDSAGIATGRGSRGAVAREGAGQPALSAVGETARAAVARGRSAAPGSRAPRASDGEARWPAGPVPLDAGPADAVPLVVVNALGQGAGYWRLLAARLARRHRVILFQPRADIGGRPATGADQVAGIAEMLAEREVRQCHMLGWCTGAKTVLRYHLGHPGQVQSLVLLNPSFKSPARPVELDSEYERNLESMVRMLAGRPSLAPRMLRLFSGIFGDDTGSPRADGPGSVLARADPALETERRLPFATADGLLRYASQLADFWADDILADAGQVSIPVTLVTAEHDEVITGAGITAAAARFPVAAHAVIAGATHYCMHDRPEAVGAIAENMIAGAGR